MDKTGLNSGFSFGLSLMLPNHKPLITCLTYKNGEKDSSSNVLSAVLYLFLEFGDHIPIQDKSTDAMVNPESTPKAYVEEKCESRTGSGGG